MVNRALADHKDVLSPPFLCSRFSRNNNLVFTTGLNHNNMDYDAYLPIICNALASIGPETADINEQWSKLLVHGVPTYTTMTEIREIVEMQYENLILGQTSRLLAFRRYSTVSIKFSTKGSQMQFCSGKR
jgi:hypothetical protein